MNAVYKINTLLITKYKICETAEAGFGTSELSDFCQQHVMKLQIIEKGKKKRALWGYI